jgi:hypothetical protein
MNRREDAVPHDGRWLVPTEYGKTKWVTTWAEFRVAGGVMGFAEDQTTITLSLPAPYKFSIQFERRLERRNLAALAGE